MDGTGGNNFAHYNTNPYSSSSSSSSLLLTHPTAAVLLAEPQQLDLDQVLDRVVQSTLEPHYCLLPYSPAHHQQWTTAQAWTFVEWLIATATITLATLTTDPNDGTDIVQQQHCLLWLEDGLWTLQRLVVGGGWPEDDENNNDHSISSSNNPRRRWSAQLVYAVVVTTTSLCHHHHHHDKDQNKAAAASSLLLPMLVGIITSSSSSSTTTTNNMIKAAASAALSAIWNVLEQVQEDCCCGTTAHSSGPHGAWWMIPATLGSAADDDEAEQDEIARVDKMLWRLQQFAQEALMVRPEDFTPCWTSSSSTSTSLVEFKTANVQLLRHLVRYHHHHYDDILPTDRPRLPPEWIRRLTEEASRLRTGSFHNRVHHHHHHHAAVTLIALSCLELLGTLGVSHYHQEDALPNNNNDNNTTNNNNRYNSLLDDVLPNLVALAFPHHHHAENASSCISNASLVVLTTLFQSRPNYVSMAISLLQPEIRSFVEMAGPAMTAVAANNDDDNNHYHPAYDKMDGWIRRLRLLHRIDRFMVRECLLAAFSTTTTTTTTTVVHPLVDRLTYETQNNNSLVAASWLRELLLDDHRRSCPDEFSRNVLRRTGCFFDWLLALAEKKKQSSSSVLPTMTSDDEFHRPMLIIAADLCAMIVPPLYCSTEALQVLMEIVVLSPTTGRRSNQKKKATTMGHNNNGNKNDDEGDFDSDTPTAANLSRCLDSNTDHSTMMMMNWSDVEDDDEDRVDRGVDVILKLAVGLLLVTVAPLCDHPVAQDRAVEAAMKILQEVGDVATSMEVAVRTIRLTHALSTTTTPAVHEGHVATILHATGRRHYHQSVHRGNVMRQQQVTISELRAQLDASVQKQNNLRLELRQSSQQHQVEQSELQHHSAREANRAIQVHLVERQAAEEMATELQAQATDLQSQLVRAVESERAAKDSLDRVTVSSRQALEQKDKFEQQANELGSMLKERDAFIVDAKDRLQHLSDKETELLDRVHRQHEDLVDLQENETELRDGLENLFKDMVFLARMYEHQEKHAVTYTEAHKEELKGLKGRVQKLQDQNKDLAERESRVQHEKELLERKYAKLKEKWEQERREQQREDERRIHSRSTTSAGGGAGAGGSSAASYMSHLHPDQSRRRNKQHTVTSGFSNKENASSISTSSRAGSGRSQLHR